MPYGKRPRYNLFCKGKRRRTASRSRTAVPFTFAASRLAPNGRQAPSKYLHFATFNLLTRGQHRRMLLLSSAGTFATKLLDIGDGKLPLDHQQQLHRIPVGTMVVSSDELIAKVYPNLTENYLCYDWLRERAILRQGMTLLKRSIRYFSSNYLVRKGHTVPSTQHSIKKKLLITQLSF